MFVLGKPFQPSLMLASKVGSLPEPDAPTQVGSRSGKTCQGKTVTGGHFQPSLVLASKVGLPQSGAPNKVASGIPLAEKGLPGTNSQTSLTHLNATKNNFL